MRDRVVLILDFDGVVCDSIDECLLSSWIAYHSLFLDDPPASVPRTLRSQFADLRPFVRSGEDYLLIHQILAQRISVPDQQSFDALIREAGQERMLRFRELFYRARTSLLESDRDFWLTLNRIYPHVRALLESAHRVDPFPWGRFRILSTKRPEFIEEILRSAGISVPRDRVVFSGESLKLSLVERIIDEDAVDRAVFVDDQIDHLAGCSSPRIAPYLASWGYVRQDWLSGKVPVLSPSGFTKLAQEWLSGE